MKQENKKNILLILFPYLILILLDLVITRQNIDGIYFDLNLGLNEQIMPLIPWLISLVLTLPFLIWMGMTLHKVHIKREKDVKTKMPRVLLGIGLFISGYSFNLFGLNYYHPILYAIALIIVYFMILKLLDNHYIKDSTKSELKIDTALVSQFVSQFGSDANILRVSFEHSRLKVEVKDTKLVNLQGLKDSGATGVFVSGNQIQAFIGIDAESLNKSIKEYLSQ